jgi:hypothetical protein
MTGAHLSPVSPDQGRLRLARRSMEGLISPRSSVQARAAPPRFAASSTLSVVLTCLWTGVRSSGRRGPSPPRDAGPSALGTAHAPTIPTLLNHRHARHHPGGWAPLSRTGRRIGLAHHQIARDAATSDRWNDAEAAYHERDHPPGVGDGPDLRPRRLVGVCPALRPSWRGRRRPQRRAGRRTAERRQQVRSRPGRPERERCGAGG